MIALNFSLNFSPTKQAFFTSHISFFSARIVCLPQSNYITELRKKKEGDKTGDNAKNVERERERITLTNEKDNFTDFLNCTVNPAVWEKPKQSYNSLKRQVHSTS